MTAPGARAAFLTPDGRGAVAVLRVWGPLALTVADAVFRPARGDGLMTTRPGRLRLGRIGRGTGDEVVAVVIEIAGAPPEVEIQCHGGHAPRALVLEALDGAGAARATASDWLRDTARSGLEAEALDDLSRATTVRAAEILLEQAAGALEGEIRCLLDLIPGDLETARAALDRLLARAPVGLRLTTGWRVALAGRPNVGKSRLLNALAGYERAIVDPTPGTTRDVVTVRTACDGWPVEFADTAGLRASADALEASGMRLARASHAAADLVVLVLDRSAPLMESDRQLRETLAGALLAANKSDLPAAWSSAPEEMAVVSAERGDGLPALLSRIAARLVPVPTPPGAGVPFRRAHVEALASARAALSAGEGGAASDALLGLCQGARGMRASSGPADPAGVSGAS